jgi:hypothetical protein
MALAVCARRGALSSSLSENQIVGQRRLKVKRLLQGIVAVVAASFVMVGFAGTAVAGHPAAECKQYATDAVNQYKSLKAAGCSGKPGDNLWGDNYQGHYNWCLSTNADIHAQFKTRRLTIEACQAHSDAMCKAYANDAIAQVNAFAKKGCMVGSTNPDLWSMKSQDHYNWCRANIGADLAQQHKIRRVDTEQCQTAATRDSGGKGAITVSPNNGNFIVRGSGFVARRKITIRVTGAGLGASIRSRDFYGTSDGSGKFAISVNSVCGSNGVLFFVATDSVNVNTAVWTPPSGGQCRK